LHGEESLDFHYNDPATIGLYYRCLIPPPQSSMHRNDALRFPAPAFVWAFQTPKALR
jgi:hypothetical protein